jgi:hypothetical protein
MASAYVEPILRALKELSDEQDLLKLERDKVINHFAETILKVEQMEILPKNLIEHFKEITEKENTNGKK